MKYCENLWRCEHFVNIFTPIFTPMWKSPWNHKNLCFPRKSMVHTGVNTPWELRGNSVGSPPCENGVKWCPILRKHCELLLKLCGNFGKTPRNNLKISCNDDEILWTVRNVWEYHKKVMRNDVEIMRIIIWKWCEIVWG